MNELTKAEEAIMQHLWRLKKAFLKDLVAEFPDKKYTTISTTINKMVDKGFVGFKSYSKVREYFPLISKDDYFKGYFRKAVGRFFNGSVTGFASFFMEMEELSVEDLEELNTMIQSQLDQKKSHSHD